MPVKTVEEFEAQLERIIDDWVGSGGSIGDVIDALDFKLRALLDEHGQPEADDANG